MKHEKLISELHHELEQAALCQRKRVKQRKVIVGQFKSEQKQIAKKLQSADDKKARKQLKSDLKLVENGLRQLAHA